jgi:hypothetical protein
MLESLTPSKKLQWKWVGITLLLYVVFYPSPIFIAHYILAPKAAQLFIGAWLFAGIIIIGAVAGYLSEGVTLWEPAIAGAGFITLFIIAVAILSPPAGLSIFQSVVQLVIIMAIFFLFSLLGAWLGERAQKLWKTKSPESI